MKKVVFGCKHEGEAEDATPTVMGNMVMDICPRCKAVKTSDDLFVGYPCGYRMRSGKTIMAAIKEINGDQVIVATTEHLGTLTYEEWTVSKSDFHKAGIMLRADPYGTVK